MRPLTAQGNRGAGACLPPTQRDRVLYALRERGAHGLTQVDMHRPEDAGPPILRVASRVDELRKLGYAIETRWTPRGPQGGRMAVYVLQASPGHSESRGSRERRVTAPEEPPEALFEQPAARTSPFDPRGGFA